MDGNSQLVGRFLPYRVYARWKWTVRFGLLAVPLIVFLTGCVLYYLEPTKYESKALLEYRGERTPVEAAALLKSRTVLDEVCTALELHKRWGYDRETSIEILKGVTETEVDPATGWIGVAVTHTEKESARDIAAELPKALTRYEIRLATTGIESRRQALIHSLRDNEDKAEERRKSYLQLISVRGEQPTEPASKLDVSASRIEWEEECRRVIALRGRISDLELDAAGLEKACIVHTDPVISQNPAGKKSEDSLGDLSLSSLGYGLLFALLAPYVFELACPDHRQRLKRPQKKSACQPSGNEWSEPSGQSDLVPHGLKG